MAVGLDEVRSAQGQMSGPWRRMLGTLLGLGSAALRERSGEIDQAFAEIGATSIQVGAGAGLWHCDPIPLLMTEREFTGLAEGLIQRARVLEAMLGDLYGERRLLAEAVLPPPLVYGAQRYMAACRTLPAGRQIGMYAADLIRGADGQWRVVADRTGEPTGLAYVLENRRILARVLPELFRQFDVAEVRPFFDAWADHLRDQGRAIAEPPGLAMLTPGHTDPRWFEHVMLARTLGLAMVEPGDLTVRDGALWVKTLRGLQPIHMLLRRIDGRHLDPLELAGEGGTPGVLHALRSGTLRMLNAPGASFAECPALAQFLPRIAQRLLGETLTLESVPSRWLGEAGAEEAELARPAGLVLRASFEGAAPAQAWDLLNAEARAQLRAAIAQNPAGFVATRPPAPSTVPCVGQGETLESRAIMLRLFLVAEGEGWRALPGGLVRVLGEAEVPGGPLAAGARAKDVWVLREEGDIVGGSGNHAVPALNIRRMAGDLPSRVADNFFWLGRYLERLDMAVRLSRALLHRLGRAAPLPHEVPEIAVLAACLADAGVINAEHTTASGQAILSSLLQAALTRESGVVAQTCLQIGSLAARLRDRLSFEMHDSITHGLRSLKGARLVLTRNVRADPGLLLDLCGRVLGFSATVAGYAAENMVRGGGRLFLDLGRRIERGQAVANQLRHALNQPASRIEAGLALGLELCDSTITYRSRYLNVIQPAPVLDLVLSDDGNPRGLGYQIAQSRLLLAALGAGNDGELAVLLDPLAAETRLIVADLLASADQAAAAASMAQRLQAVEQEWAAISDAITRRYFALLPMTTMRMAVPA